MSQPAKKGEAVFFSLTIRPRQALALALAVIFVGVPIAQAGRVPAAGEYGPLDPWAYNLIHRAEQAIPRRAGAYGPVDPPIAAAIYTHHSGDRLAPKATAASLTVAASRGFNWSDAGVGAAVAIAAILLAAAAGTFVHRTRLTSARG